MEYPEYVLPQDNTEREAIKQEIIKFVSERCRLTQEEISSYISSTIQPKLDGTYQNPYGRQLRINFNNSEAPTLQLNPRAHLVFGNMMAIQRILSESNQYAPQFFAEKLRKLQKHNLGYDSVRSTRQLSSNFNYVDRIDYTTYMKRLLLESGQSRADYQWKAILDKLFLDLDKPTNNKYTSNENSTFKVKAQRQQLEARKRALELQLAQINMKLEINEQELVSLPQPEDQIALVQTSIL